MFVEVKLKTMQLERKCAHLIRERDLKMVQIMCTLYCGVGQGGFRIALMFWKFIPDCNTSISRRVTTA